MSSSVASRIAFPGHLRDPNYYRLGYQLAALRANDAAAWRWGEDDSSTEARAERRKELAVRWRAVGRDKARLAAIVEGLADARLLAQRTAEVLDWFQQREQYAWRLRGLDVQERRLQRFLAGTVEPCLALAIAGLELERRGPSAARRLSLDFLEGSPRVAVERTGLQGTPHVRVLSWSYRALYNVACLCAVRRDCGVRDEAEPWRLSDATGLTRGLKTKESTDVGLWALGQALARVHGPALAGLLVVAEKDPTLQLMRRDPQVADEFEEILAQYRLPDVTAPLQKAPAHEAPPAEPDTPLAVLLSWWERQGEPALEGLSGDELRAFDAARDLMAWDGDIAVMVLRAGVWRKLQAQRLGVAGVSRPLSLDTPDAWRLLYELLLLEGRGS